MGFDLKDSFEKPCPISIKLPFENISLFILSYCYLVVFQMVLKQIILNSFKRPVRFLPTMLSKFLQILLSFSLPMHILNVFSAPFGNYRESMFTLHVTILWNAFNTCLPCGSVLYNMSVHGGLSWQFFQTRKLILSFKVACKLLIKNKKTLSGLASSVVRA